MSTLNRWLHCSIFNLEVAAYVQCKWTSADVYGQWICNQTKQYSHSHSSHRSFLIWFCVLAFLVTCVSQNIMFLQQLISARIQRNIRVLPMCAFCTIMSVTRNSSLTGWVTEWATRPSRRHCQIMTFHGQMNLAASITTLITRHDVWLPNESSSKHYYVDNSLKALGRWALSEQARSCQKSKFANSQPQKV